MKPSRVKKAMLHLDDPLVKVVAQSIGPVYKKLSLASTTLSSSEGGGASREHVGPSFRALAHFNYCYGGSHAVVPIGIPVRGTQFCIHTLIEQTVQDAAAGLL